MNARADAPAIIEDDSDPLLARQERRESSARTYPRHLPIALVRARGPYLYDSAGREYLDCLAGAGALALGHHHPVVVEAIERALKDEIPFSTLDFATPVKDAFVEELFGILPPGLADGRVLFCGPTGADAVEAALKLAKLTTGRTGVIAFGGGYHGMSQGALALTGARAPKEGLGPLLPDVHHLPFPNGPRCPFGVGGEAGAELCARTLQWALEDDHSGISLPAAVVMEPVQGEGGVHVAPASFAAAVGKLTAAAGSLLVVDEIQTGLGRTGSLWGCDEAGIEPDILVLSKAIGGGLPLALIVYRAELDGWPSGSHAGTFRGNQLAMAAGTATIRHVVDAGLPAHAAAMGERLMDGLGEAVAELGEAADVRGRGLMVGVELMGPGLARRVQRAMLELGVIVEVGGREDAVVRFLPPLIVTVDHIDRAVEAFAAALARILAE